jgi:parallel beta-helix repeat protein
VLRDSVQATISGNLFTGNRGCGIYSDSSKEVRGEANKMADNGNDLCGNLPGSLRLPLREPTEEEITWPDERYKSLQEAVDALLPGGRLRLQVGEHQAGVTIAKELRVEAEEGGKVTLMAKSWEAPVLSLVGVAKVELVGLELSNGSEGLLVGADAQATITNSSLSENGWDGIKLVGSAQATISSSTLSENGYNGIELWGSATVTLKESTVEKNGTSESCAGADWICNGVMVVGESQMTIIDSKIINNADWGVAAVQEKCGYRKDDFTGKVVFEGTNTIEGNNTSGNQNGMGNPGNHYWNQPNVPDGQVCLP